MKQSAYRCAAAVVIAALLIASPAAGQEPLRNAHAHNDYEHSRPLSDALEHGFISIEVDVHLVGDTLFVAHDPEDIRPGRTLEALYLEPLLERVRRNGGTVYAGGRSLILLIDIKSDAEATYHVLSRVLGDYADMLTQFTRDDMIEGAVTAIVSGNRPRAAMMDETHRFAAYDGRLDDLTAHRETPPASIPLVSSHWSAISTWQGEGPMPDTDRERLRQVVAEAHQQGRMLRFWGTADTSSVWKVLSEEGVDLIGTDDLGALRSFLASAEPK